MIGAYLVPLLLGFGFDCASAFTAAFSRLWGDARGRLATVILRNVLGIPVWVIGLVMAARAPAFTVFLPSVWLDAMAWLLMGGGAAIQILAIAALRMKAAAPSRRDALVSWGVYGRIRHPIYAGLLLQFAGFVLVNPRQTMAVASLLGVAWLFLQASLEERDLLERMPAYEDYMRRVPGFVPRRWPRVPARKAQ